MTTPLSLSLQIQRTSSGSTQRFKRNGLREAMIGEEEEYCLKYIFI